MWRGVACHVLDVDHAVILNGKRCHAEPCGGGRRDGENRATAAMAMNKDVS